MRKLFIAPAVDFEDLNSSLGVHLHSVNDVSYMVSDGLKSSLDKVFLAGSAGRQRQNHVHFDPNMERLDLWQVRHRLRHCFEN